MTDPSAFIQQTVRSVTDPDRLTEALGAPRAATLHDGLPGTALLLAALSRTDPRLADATAHHWDASARLLTGVPPDGIFKGPGALATSLILGSRYLPHPASQRTAVEHATAWLSARAQGLARHQDQRRRDGRPGTPWAIYDAVKGLAGIGRILLAADQSGHSPDAALGLTAALTALTTMINTTASPHPGWRLPARDHVLPGTRPLPPSGAATTGAAHGIAGPLAFLATAHAAARTVPGQLDAIRAAARWLLEWRSPDGTWPAHIPGYALSHGPQAAAVVPGRRDAGCYGNTGIGNALTLAAVALHDDELRRRASSALDAVAARPPEAWDTAGPGLCHGTAGVLLTAWHHSHCALATAAEQHTLQLLSAQLPSEDRGLLTGTTGTALALAESVGVLPHPSAAAWHSILQTGPTPPAPSA